MRLDQSAGYVRTTRSAGTGCRFIAAPAEDLQGLGTPCNGHLVVPGIAQRQPIHGLQV
jgi:hypothetical protein